MGGDIQRTPGDKRGGFGGFRVFSTQPAYCRGEVYQVQGRPCYTLLYKHTVLFFVADYVRFLRGARM